MTAVIHRLAQEQERKLQIQYFAVSTLNPYALNARTHEPWQVGQIADSIKQFGFTNPVLIDEAGEIIAGHGRVMAAHHLGMDEVPCVVLAHLTEDQKRAYRLADNKIALNSGWDLDKLTEELSDLAKSYDVSGLGFSQDELDALISQDYGALVEGWSEAEDLSKTARPRKDPDEAPVVEPEQIVTSDGDIWQLGEHLLICGDSTNPDVLRRLMAGQMANLIVTDPPYNVAYEGGTAERLTIENDSMSSEAFYDFLLAAFKAMHEVAEKGASIYVFHADTEGANFRKSLVMAGFKFSQCLVWVKQSIVLGRQDYHWKHEPILYGWKRGAGHRWFSDRSQSTVWNFDRPSRNDVHPTMKPVQMLEYAIGNSSEAGELVLDPFGGSGSTLIACENLGRKARLCELDPRYCDVIVRRWEQYTGKKAVLIK